MTTNRINNKSVKGKNCGKRLLSKLYFIANRISQSGWGIWNNSTRVRECHISPSCGHLSYLKRGL